MIDDYIYNINNAISNMLFYFFIVSVVCTTILIVFSLIMLIIGYKLKSQTIRAKFLRIVPIGIVLLIFILIIPELYITIVNII